MDVSKSLNYMLGLKSRLDVPGLSVLDWLDLDYQKILNDDAT